MGNMAGFLRYRHICQQSYNVNSGIMKVLAFIVSVQPELERNLYFYILLEPGDRAESESGCFQPP